MEAMGVFDGHGGKGAGQYTAKHIMSAVTAGLKESGVSKSSAEQGESEGSEMAGLQSDLAGDDVDAWQLQDAAVEQLPEALSHAFQQVQQDFFAQSKQSGTTATLVTLVGWDVFVANVGDSCAYLDTGCEVLQVSGNHRLDDAKGERERVEAAGSNVSQSNLDGKPVGPMRVWPGGLAMSRSIGDHEAGEAVISTPEVRHAVLPESGGRIIVASDGLWDAINPKTAAHHVRGTPASKAAHDLVQAALKKRGMRDDITVIVIDACPSAEDRMPGPLLSRKSSGSSSAHSCGGGGDLSERVHIRKPLEEPWLAARNEEVGQRRMAAARAMLSQSDDLSSLSSSPWSSTISSLSDSSAFQLSSSLEATSSLAALAEEHDEDLASEPEPGQQDPAPHEPASDVEELDEDAGWETVAKPSSKSAHGKDKPDEMVQNVELVEERPIQHQHKFHKPTPAHGRGRGGARRGGRGGRAAHSAARSATEDSSVRVVPRPPPRSSQQAVQGDTANPTGHARQQGSRGRGRRAPRTPFAGNLPSEQMAPVVQTGFQPAGAAEEPVGQPNRRPRERYQERRGRANGQRGRGSSSAPQRTPVSDRRESEQHAKTSSSHQHSEGGVPTRASAPVPAIQFGQFAAGSFNLS